MRTSGRSHEGWMTLIPLSVLLFIVVIALGGPEALLTSARSIAADAISYGSTFLKRF